MARQQHSAIIADGEAGRGAGLLLRRGAERRRDGNHRRTSALLATQKRWRRHHRGRRRRRLGGGEQIDGVDGAVLGRGVEGAGARVERDAQGRAGEQERAEGHALLVVPDDARLVPAAGGDAEAGVGVGARPGRQRRHGRAVVRQRPRGLVLDGGVELPQARHRPHVDVGVVRPREQVEGRPRQAGHGLDVAGWRGDLPAGADLMWGS